MPRLLVLLLCAASLAAVERDMLFQYSLPPKDAAAKGAFTTYLWVPPEAEVIRGALVGGNILMEPDFVADPVIRAACAQRSLAIVYFSGHLNAVFPYQEAGSTCAADLERVFVELADLSGHPELAQAPLMPFGHSVASIFASRVLFWKPERCFAALTYKGGFCVPEGEKTERIHGVPVLHIQGQFEEFGPGPSGVLRENEDRETGWKTALESLAKRRIDDPGLLLGLLVEDGSTHMPWTFRLSKPVADFIRAAADLRLPAKPGEPLKAVEAAAGVEAKLGEATFWYPAPGVAKLVVQHFAAKDLKPQFVSFADGKGNPVPVMHDMRMKITPQNQGDDEISVAGTFCKAAPKKYPPVEGEAGHGEGAVRFQAYGGGLEQTGPDTFRVVPDPRASRPAVLAFHPGDATWRYAEQPATLNGIVPKAGKAHSITFAPLGSKTAKDFPLTLTATSDSGLPVHFLVVSGPARVKDGKLVIADLPKKATSPLPITVMAYSPGTPARGGIAAANVTQVITFTP